MGLIWLESKCQWVCSASRGFGGESVSRPNSKAILWNKAQHEGHQYLTYTSSSINKKHHHSSQHKPQEVKAVSRWLVRSIPVNRITVCKCQVTYFLFLELGCHRFNDWKNTVILLFPLCQSLSLPYFFFFCKISG